MATILNHICLVCFFLLFANSCNRQFENTDEDSSDYSIIGESRLIDSTIYSTFREFRFVDTSMTQTQMFLRNYFGEWRTIEIYSLIRTSDRRQLQEEPIYFTIDEKGLLFRDVYEHYNAPLTSYYKICTPGEIIQSEESEVYPYLGLDKNNISLTLLNLLGCKSLNELQFVCSDLEKKERFYKLILFTNSQTKICISIGDYALIAALNKP